MLRETRELFQYSAAFSSILTNAFLIFLIARKSPKHIGNYKYLLICIALFELIYGILDIIASPIVDLFGPTFLVIVPHKDKGYGPKTAMFLNAVYCGFFGFSMGMFVIIFAYRLLVLTGNKGVMDTFQGLKIISWFTFPLFYGIVWGLSALFPFAPTPGMDEFLRESIVRKLNMSIDDVAYTGALFFNQNGEERVINYTVLTWTSALWTLTTSSLFLVGFFGTKCFVHINELLGDNDGPMSKKLKDTQNQLFLALVFQASIPVILMHIPVIFLYTCSLLNLDVDATFVAVTIALFPALDPFPTLIIIKNYRQAIFGYMKRLLKCFRLPGSCHPVATTGNQKNSLQ